jgi:hypothetical protein
MRLPALVKQPSPEQQSLQGSQTMRSDGGDGEIVAATITIGDPAKPVLQGKAVTNQGAASPPQGEEPAAPGAEPSESVGDALTEPVLAVGDGELGVHARRMT